MDAFIKRLLTILVAAFLLCYVGYQAFQIFYSPIETETVYSYSVYETVDTEGFVVRNEKVLTKEVSGYIYYTAENGSRVAKDDAIAYVYESENDARLQQQINQLSAEIEQLRTIQSQGTSGRVNLDIINKQIDNALEGLMDTTNSASFTSLYGYHEQLLALLNKRQMTIGKATDFEERIAVLTQKKADLTAALHPSSQTITSSEVAGYFVSRADGYEDTLSYKEVAGLAPNEVAAALKASPADIPAAAVGKVVGDYEWYLTCVLPVEKTTAIHEGDSLTIRLPFVSKEAVPVTVAAVNRERGGTAAVIFKCSYMSKELSGIRKEAIQIQVKHHEGLRVPTSAVRTNENNETGVYIRMGNAVAFRKIKIEYSTTEYSICKEVGAIKAENPDAEIDEKAYLRLYDEIISEGKGLYDGKIIN